MTNMIHYMRVWDVDMNDNWKKETQKQLPLSVPD